MHVDAATESEQTALSLVVIGAVGCAALAAQTFIRPNLDGDSLKSLALSYRARFMLRLGFSEAVMLIAFAVSRDRGGSYSSVSHSRSSASPGSLRPHAIYNRIRIDCR